MLGFWELVKNEEFVWRRKLDFLKEAKLPISDAVCVKQQQEADKIMAESPSFNI